MFYYFFSFCPMARVSPVASFWTDIHGTSADNSAIVIPFVQRNHARHHYELHWAPSNLYGVFLCSLVMSDNDCILGIGVRTMNLFFLFSWTSGRGLTTER